METNNILYDILPTCWREYQINTWFQVGVQIYVLGSDEALADFEKSKIIIYLLFSNEDGTIREHPTGEALKECMDWFLNGWCHDNAGKQKSKQKVMDYTIDQWRIYADFMQIYRINLNETDMHWWEFCGLLWNMPYKYSSFLQVINIRKKKITNKMDKETKEAIKEAKQVYELKQPEIEKAYTEEEKKKIDDYDRMMLCK